MLDWKQEYTVKFEGLKTGIHNYRFQLDKEFFDHFELSQISECDINADIEWEIFSNMMVLVFTITGTVQTECDRCQDPISIEVFVEEKLIVKYGETTSTTDDEILILGLSEFELDLTRYLYEYSHLAIPSKKVHEDEADCNQEVIGHLYGHDDVENDDQQETDPRWDQLNKLK